MEENTEFWKEKYESSDRNLQNLKEHAHKGWFIVLVFDRVSGFMCHFVYLTFFAPFKTQYRNYKRFNKPYWSSVRGKCLWINKLRSSEPGSDFYEMKNAK